MFFKYKDKVIKSGEKTILCGIINVTPDSFSDGGKYNSVEKALERAKKLVADGAQMLDIGGESTRPGSHYVQVEEEIERVVPAISAIKKELDVIISIDTWKAEVAKAAIDAGADIVNDITGLLGDKNMAEVVGKSNAGLIIMNNPVIARPDHPSSKIFPKFGDNVFTESELSEFMKMSAEDAMVKYFEKSLEIARTNNISDERIMLDPGIGFGLTKKENLSLIKNIDIIREMGFFTFLGVSRKRFIINLVGETGADVDFKGDEGIKNADKGSAVLTAIASYKGVEVLRVHSVKDHLIAAKIADSVRLSDEMEDINFNAYK